MFCVVRATQDVYCIALYRMQAVSKRMHKDMRKCNECESGNPQIFSVYATNIFQSLCNICMNNAHCTVD